MRRHGLLLVTLFHLVGCSSTDSAGQSNKVDDPREDDAAGGSDGGGLDSGLDGSGEEFSWWRLDADLVVVEGELSVEGSRFSAALLDDAGIQVCVVDAAPGDVTPFLVMPDELVLAWWEVGGLQWTGDCPEGWNPSELPDAFHIGVGLMHPEITAVIDAMPEVGEGGGESLNAAYAQFPGVDAVYVFGAVGPAEAWDGAGAPASVAPLADGTWELRGAYGFPL